MKFNARKLKRGIICAFAVFTIFVGLKPEKTMAMGIDDPTMGGIELMSRAVSGWHECDGSRLSISQNTALFTLLGTDFGGDGQVTFALPDLRGANPYAEVAGLKYYIAMNGIFGGLGYQKAGEVLLLPDRVAQGINTYRGTLLLKCDGRQALSTEFQALYSAIGTTYGGNSTTFNMPNLTAASPAQNMSYYITVSSSDEPTAYMGGIALFAGTNSDDYLVNCDGRLLNVIGNQALYALVGNFYGGDKNITLAIPDLKGLAPLPGMTYKMVLSGLFPVAD